MRLKIAARRHPVRAAAAQSAASRRQLDRSGWVASFPARRRGRPSIPIPRLS